MSKQETSTMHRMTCKRLSLLVVGVAVWLWQGLMVPAFGATYHGNQNSHAFHAPECRDFNCPNCTAVFTSYAAAVNAGYHPHKECVGDTQKTKTVKPPPAQPKTEKPQAATVKPQSEEASAEKAKTEKPQPELTIKDIGTYRDKTLVQGAGEVSRILEDDRDGIKHQRFILKLTSGRTLLVAHNTDAGRRVENLQVGDIVEFSGESAENNEGGGVHWTHRDLKGVHPNGWLKVKGQTYQ